MGYEGVYMSISLCEGFSKVRVLDYDATDEGGVWGESGEGNWG